MLTIEMNMLSGFFSTSPGNQQAAGGLRHGRRHPVMGMLLIAIAMGVVAQGLRGLLPGLD